LTAAGVQQGGAAAPASPGEELTARRDALIVVVAGLIFFGLNVDFVMRGDASMYADYVLLGKFDELTVHTGYYWLMFALHQTIGRALGIPVHELMVWIDVVFGGLSLGVMYFLARHFLGSRRDAVLCVVIVALCGRFTMSATSSEIYIPQVFFVMSSFLLFVRERIVAAGLVGALALLISPLSVFAYLFFPVYDYQRAGRVRVGVLLALAGSALLVYGPFLLFTWTELLWGRRGLLGINDLLPPEPRQMIRNFLLFQFKSYTFLLLLVIPALLAARRHLRFLALTLAVTIPHVLIVLKLVSEDNVFLLNTDFFFACWLVLGWRYLERTVVGRWLAPLPLAAHALVLLLSGSIMSFEYHRGFSGEMRMIAGDYLQGRDAGVISDWDGVISLTFFGRERVYSTIERDSLFSRMYDITRLDRRDSAVLNRAELYLLDPWGPGPLKKLFASEESIAADREQHSIVARANRELGLTCTLEKQLTFPFYRCSRRAPGGT
jgi:hypothetical protein